MKNYVFVEKNIVFAREILIFAKENKVFTKEFLKIAIENKVFTKESLKITIEIFDNKVNNFLFDVKSSSR